jgi:hypothetical protein
VPCSFYQDVTSEQGLAGFVNVQPGIVVVTAFPEDGARAMSVDTFLVRSGWVTIQTLVRGSAQLEELGAAPRLGQALRCGGQA